MIIYLVITSLCILIDAFILTQFDVTYIATDNSPTHLYSQINNCRRFTTHLIAIQWAYRIRHVINIVCRRRVCRKPLTLYGRWLCRQCRTVINISRNSNLFIFRLDRLNETRFTIILNVSMLSIQSVLFPLQIFFINRTVIFKVFSLFLSFYIFPKGNRCPLNSISKGTEALYCARFSLRH